MYIDAYLHRNMHTIKTYIHTYIHTYMHACMHACMHIHTYKPIYRYTHIYMYIYIYIHTYAYTYIAKYTRICADINLFIFFLLKLDGLALFNAQEELNTKIQSERSDSSSKDKVPCLFILSAGSGHVVHHKRPNGIIGSCSAVESFTLDDQPGMVELQTRSIQILIQQLYSPRRRKLLKRLIVALQSRFRSLSTSAV